MNKDRWQNLSLAEQWGNIGSEISRAQTWEKVNDSFSRNKALERALELLDYTLADKQHKHRLKEISRFREAVCDLIAGTHFYSLSPKDLIEICSVLVTRKIDLK